MKHMKHLAIALLMVFTLMLTGCVRLNVELTIKDDGKADVSVLYAVMADVADEDTELSDEEKNEIIREDGEYAAYNEDGYVGYTISVKDVLMEDLGKDKGLGEVSDDMSITKTENGYRFESTLFGGENSDEIQDTLAYLDTYGGYMKFTLHLPKPAVSSNATTVDDDGKTLIWDATAMGSTGTMYAEFDIPRFGAGGFNPLFLYIGIGAALVLIVIVVIIVTRKKKPAAPSVPGEYTFCTQCGAKMAKGTAFCTNCGAKLATETVTAAEVPATEVPAAEVPAEEEVSEAQPTEEKEQ